MVEADLYRVESVSSRLRKNWSMMLLLIKFGADRAQKDSWGKQAKYYVPWPS